MNHRIRECLGCALLASCVAAAGGVETCQAQGADEAGEIRARIERLMREAEEHAQAGRAEAAERFMSEADELRVHLDRRHEGDEGHRRRLLDQVERAVGALHELGRPEAAEQLERALQSLSRDAREGDRRERDESPEGRAARRQLEGLHAAMEALASAGRGDAANKLERAIHAQRLGIEGRRDDETQAARRASPNRDEQAELLMMASRILERRGQPDRERVVGELARNLAMREGPAREADERAPRAPSEDREHVGSERRLDMLEARLREVTNAVEHLHAEFRELRRER